MREYWIETNPINFLAIIELRIELEVNEHGTAYIKGYISDENEEEYRSTLMNDTWMEITAVGSLGKKEPLFCGIIIGYKVESGKDQKLLELELKSGTFLMDAEKHIRLFQQENITYQMLLNKIISPYYKNGFITNEEINSVIQDFIVQYEESDWELLKRVASKINLYLIPSIKNIGVRFYLGLPNGKHIGTIGNNKYQIEKDLNGYRKKKKQGLDNISETDSIMYHFWDREIYRIGDIVEFQGINLCIYSIKSEFSYGEILHFYSARIKNSLRVPMLKLYNVQGCCMLADITEVKGNKVRIRVYNDELNSERADRWYSYSTPYSASDGTGWYCMPEVGDRVRVFFPTYNESDSYVISSVHLDTNNEERTNPDNKIWKTKYQKEIRFTPDRILITNNKGMSIEMIDEEGIFIESDKSVAIEAGKEISIISEDSTLILAADKSLALNQGETAIQIDNKISFIGGEFRIQ